MRDVILSTFCFSVGNDNSREARMSQLVLVDVADGVMTVTLNRPERKNALSNEAMAG